MITEGSIAVDIIKMKYPREILNNKFEYIIKGNIVLVKNSLIFVDLYNPQWKTQSIIQKNGSNILIFREV